MCTANDHQQKHQRREAQFVELTRLAFQGWPLGVITLEEYPAVIRWVTSAFFGVRQEAVAKLHIKDDNTKVISTYNVDVSILKDRFEWLANKLGGNQRGEKEKQTTA